MGQALSDSSVRMRRGSPGYSAVNDPSTEDVGRDHAVGAVAIALDHHLQVLVPAEVGDLTQRDVGVDRQ